jgi:hypothetical protein
MTCFKPGLIPLLCQAANPKENLCHEVNSYLKEEAQQKDLFYKWASSPDDSSFC